ncbi:transmembrane protein 200A-like [Acipenser oxyrinchus oxyrinchus]|uniref:Transmembrane protein 200A-like n=1 Tax=Acipenser oxyrinchus oxyrinchus TaxID=40147 RepID=A0AAD8GGD2_ACIOX|nr:transmembrane protein 200A-like [Acipenser oxyrinchus oxyrinchus]
MIATGGLLRISSRRQDSLRSKSRTQNKQRKRKAKKKRKSDVVVVKGKLKLCSISGLIAAFGILVLLVGITMAVMGYWPENNPIYQDNFIESKRLPNNRRIYDNKLFASTNWTRNSHVVYQIDLDWSKNNHSNSTEMQTSLFPSLSFFSEFLASYLHSDKLKVFGPLIMGIGIFLFICANAVLHENRDKKTKIINLRDIYSTVIDIHSLRSKDCTPLNGFVNYVQSRNVDMKSSGSYSAAMLVTSSWPSTAGETVKPQEQGGSIEAMRHQSLARQQSLTKERQSFTDTVYSIYRDQSKAPERVPIPKKWETKSIVTSSINAFTLPVIKLNNCVLDENSAKQVESGVKEAPASKSKTVPCDLEMASPDPIKSDHIETKEETSKTDLFPCKDISPVHQNTSSLQGASPSSPLGSQVQLLPPSPSKREMGSDISLGALSTYSKTIDLGDCPSTADIEGDTSRHPSCPLLECSNSKGYLKLVGVESFESSEVTVARREDCKETSVEDMEDCIVQDAQENTDKTERGIQRQYTNREKLLMISKSNATVMIEDEELESTGI